MPEPQATEDLYGVLPSDFTAARNALVKRLKSEGETDEAARVSRLRRPSSTTWALNQVARHQQELVARVLESGRQLRAAATSALGGDRTGLAEARANERDAIDAVVEAAARRLEGAGMSAGGEPRRKMAETLRSATVDEAVAALLVRGALEADQAAVGFDFGPVLALPREADPSPDKGTRSTRAATRRHQEARKLLATEIEHLRDKARAAHRAADEAATAAARLSRQAAAADAALAEAEQRYERFEP